MKLLVLSLSALLLAGATVPLAAPPAAAAPDDTCLNAIFALMKCVREAVGRVCAALAIQCVMTSGAPLLP